MTPILWSFRRCPYAMRARLAIASAGVAIEHREILLRDKPHAFLTASPEGTVPVVQTAEQSYVHSYDIMLWALGQNDPENLLDQPAIGTELTIAADGPFKIALDRYKYHVRIDGAEPKVEREKALAFLQILATQMGKNAWLFGATPRLADLAILPFVRQFAHVDIDWFNATAPREICLWLDRFKASDRFAAIMKKHPIWSPEAPCQRQ